MDAATVEERRDVLSPDRTVIIGNEEANSKDAKFEALFFKFYSRVVRVLCGLVGDRARAEELASDAFWRLYRQPWLEQSDGNVGGWLHRTATNLGIDHLRAQGRRMQHMEGVERAENLSGHAANPLEEILSAERALRVRRVLARLKTSHAQILILRANGLSYSDLAESLGVRLGTVGTMLVRAEAAFQKQYRRMYGKEEAL